MYSQVCKGRQIKEYKSEIFLLINNFLAEITQLMES